MAGEYVEFQNNSQPALNEDNLNLMQQLIKQDIQGAVSGDTLPVGAIIPFGSDTVPENWLLCDGSAVSRTTYQQLFNTIGVSFGQGDGFTTFNLPDLRDRVPIGKDTTDTDFDVLGKTAGERKHTLTVNEMPAHKHTAAGIVTVGDRVGYFAIGGSTGATGNITAVGNTGGGQAHNITQPSIATNYIIKATQSAGIVATVIDNLNSTSTTNALSANQGRVLKGTTLYSNSNGTTGDITLNENSSNFSKIEYIYYVLYNNEKVYNTTGKIPVASRVHLNSVFIGTGSQFNAVSKRLNISGTSVEVGSDRSYNSSGTGTDGTFTYITEIIGYNY